MSATLSIDGDLVLFQDGDTVLDVARTCGIFIPALCYHRKTGPAGRCRTCVVEVEELPGLQTACSLTARDGMVVRTDTEEIRNAQRMLVNLLLSSGSHNCLSCEANGSCELQEAAYFLGIDEPAFVVEEHEHGVDESSEMIVVDHRRCIKCGRCVAADNNTVVHSVLDFGFRGTGTKVICDDDVPLGESSCVLCGECSQICPVGAILDKASIGKGRPWDQKKIDTVCGYCGVGCQIILHVDTRTDRIVKVTGVEGNTVNDGMLCIKGRYAFDFVGSSERLTTPLVRDENGELKETTWENAIRVVASTLKEIRETRGPDAVCGLASAKVTNEENFAFQKFFRKEIGTNNVDHCARLCHSATVAGLAASLGSGAMTNDIGGIGEADVILITGSDTSATHPVIASYIKRAVKFGGTKLIVIDPKEIDMAKHAVVYARQRCGTDVAVINGIMHEIIRNGWHDAEYIVERCEGFEDLERAVAEYPPEKVEKISGVPAEKIRLIAKLIGEAETAAVFFAMGITQHTSGTDNVWSIANLQMLCGNLGKRGGGVNPLRGQCNVQGACDMGSLPNVFSGYQKVDDPTARKKFEKAWNVVLPAKPGLTVTEMISGIEKGDVEALYIMGENPMLSDPDISHVEKELRNVKFLVVQDIFLTETAALADVVLPAACFAEKDGHFTNTERRVLQLRRAVSPPGEAREDWIILQDIANAMGGDWSYLSARDITREINRLTPSYAGITWERVGTSGLQWPCPSEDHPGTPYLHREKFVRGKGFMKGIHFKEPDELPDSDYPLVLTTGRVLQQFHTRTMSGKTEGINRLAGPMVMISVEDADELGIGRSQKVKVSTRRGEIEAPAFVTKRVGKGTIFIPFHYGEAAANLLTNPALDPIAKIPEYKVCAARVQPVAGDPS